MFPLLLLAALPLGAQETLRGEVRVEIEAVPREFMDVPPPPDDGTVRRRALDAAALFFSGMIYGWSFYYDIGERARGIAEEFELTPLGSIVPGDPRLRVTDARVEDMRLYVWADYRPSDSQRRRLAAWKAGAARTAQAVGRGSLGLPESEEGWLDVRQAALKDAARAAVRGMLRGGERNRPKAARGFISLAAFPRCYMDAGRWAAAARFHVDVREVIPFSAY